MAVGGEIDAGVLAPGAAEGQLFWSGLVDDFGAGPALYNYTQTLANHVYALQLHRNNSGTYEFEGWVDGHWLFACTAGVRVLTGLASTTGKMPVPTAVWGIDNTTHTIQLRWSSFKLGLRVQPNEEWKIMASPLSGLQAELARKASFVSPHT